ncbi:MAG: hypothetical protein ACOY81_10665 [Bacillota bacterium]|uniref:hypothetical protein n=1 Tax=Desulfurispora thermophila TaxID=265470 RepID=UPI000374E22E|nr:hypothetical protein [Desulfurispora thermophila]
MSEYQAIDGPAQSKIRARIRLDFKGTAKSRRIFGGKSIEKAAEEAREYNAAMFRNIPIQGLTINDIDLGMEVYTVFDDVSNAECAYAPVVLDVSADSVEELLKLVTREDFRKIEILSPPTMTVSRYELERLFFRLSEEMRNYRNYLERKYNLR